MPKLVEFDKDVSDQIVALRNDGSKWDEISQAVAMPTGKCMLIFDHATVRPKDRIKNATGKDVQRLRDEESLSWGMISAITQYPESACRSLYEEATGRETRGNRIGKGGRYPNGTDAPKKVAAGTKKTVAKKAAAKAAPKIAPEVDGKTPEEIKEAVEGHAIKVLVDGTEETIKVKAVTKVSKTSMALRDADGQGRTVKLATVTAVSKGKVVRG